MQRQMVSEWRIGKNFEWSGRGLILGTIPAFAWRDWVKQKKLNKDGRSLGRDLNPRPPEYEAGVFTSRPWRSVWRREEGLS
jgi:hypothetical protein